MSSIDQPLRVGASRPPLRRPRRWRKPLLRLVRLLIDWQRRAEERQAIEELDERMLRDIGASRIALLRSLKRPDE